MYSRVKRKRVQVKRNMYGVPVTDESDSDQEEGMSCFIAQSVLVQVYKDTFSICVYFIR